MAKEIKKAAAPAPAPKAAPAIETVNTEAIVNRVVELAAAEGTTLTKKLAKEVIDHFTTACTEFLGDMKKVQIPGFVTFDFAYRGERVGNNIKTNQPMDIAATVGVKASAGSKLKNAVKENLDPEKVRVAKGK